VRLSCPLEEAFKLVIGSKKPSPSVINVKVFSEDGTPIFILSPIL
jgi:hypothetical protein